jgi:hypothetical protein
MNNPDYISENLKIIIWVKIFQSLMRIRIWDPGSGIFLTRDLGWKKFEYGMEKIRIWDKHPGSPTLIVTARAPNPKTGSFFVCVKSNFFLTKKYRYRYYTF